MRKRIQRVISDRSLLVSADGNSNTVAVARSGNGADNAPAPYKVLSLIGEQDFVDIHILHGYGGAVFLQVAQTWLLEFMI